MADLDKWKELAEKELRGKPLDGLNWLTPEGIAIKPLYTAEDLEKLDRDKPLAFKASVTKDDQFIKIATRKVMALEDAGKEKIKTRVREIAYDPITLEVAMQDDPEILQRLYDLIRQHSGNHKLYLVIKSKLQDVQIETGYSISKEAQNVLTAFPEVKLAG